MTVRTPQTDQEWEEYYDLRYRVLREPLKQVRGSERNEGDQTGQHFALFDQNKIVAIARLDQAEPHISQVRFVAVDHKTQGKGFGRIIMEAVEEASKEQANIKMILQARHYSVDFYKHLGYTLLEKSHMLFGQVQHFKMEKEYE